ncbi:MAG: SoxR reducing system RseC family protein [Firmicutes bacterium]|nr:SoxR reducing system RseC family protein [Bacillota bacterium]
MGDWIREVGQVVATEGPLAKVIVKRRSSCDKCGVCGMGNKPEIRFMLNNQIGAKVGDRVVVQIRSRALYKAAFLVYIIPLAALISGFILGQSAAISAGVGSGKAELIGIGTGFLGLSLAFLILRWFDRFRGLGSKLQPQLVEVLKVDDSSC